jgi:mono/diheme cytochrome c family protein
MNRVNHRASLFAVALPLLGALALTACGSVQQPAATTMPSSGPSQPESVTSSPDASQPETVGSAGMSVLNGVFTAQQASRGETRFQQVCQSCHRINDFSGGRFRAVWVGRTVGDLFYSMSTLMPEDDPGGLPPEEYADIVSYMLRENGYPAGDEDLATELSELETVRIEAGGA